MMVGIREQIALRTLRAASVVVAVAFVSTVIIGMVRTYSPVPFWDMWGGTLGFYLAHLDGDTSVWWAQHNEHRIVLTRLLFWLDFTLADGSGILLLATHPLLAALAVYLFFLFWQRVGVGAQEPGHKKLLDLVVACALTAWLFQWMQEENFAWAFQSQFFMAQVLPLLSLYLLARSTTAQHHQTLWFAGACVAGIASAGTMANGIICLPLMAVYALVTRQPWWRVLLLTLLAIATVTAYFTDYQSPPSHGSVTQAILQQPVDLAHYVLLYMGTPFFFLARGQPIGMAIAMVATIAMAAASVWFLISAARALWSQPADSARIWQLALVFYIIYLAGTALGTGGGRLVFGVNQALTYRYTTPALMAWAAMFVLWLPAVVLHWQKYRMAVIPAGLVLLGTMVALQTKALENRQQQVFERALAALALELDIRDEPRIRAVYEMSDGLFNVVDLAQRRRLSVFDRYPWRGLRDRVGEIHQAPRSLPACMGYIDTLSNIDDGRFSLVQGWLINTETQQPVTLITVVNQFNIIQGFALGGQLRRDVAAAHGRHALNSGFAGYLMLTDSDTNTNSTLRLIADNNTCELLPDTLPAAAGARN